MFFSVEQRKEKLGGKMKKNGGVGEGGPQPAAEEPDPFRVQITPNALCPFTSSPPFPGRRDNQWFREVELPERLVSVLFPPSPAFMNDEERHAVEEANRQAYLERLDRQLKGVIARRTTTAAGWGAGVAAEEQSQMAEKAREAARLMLVRELCAQKKKRKRKKGRNNGGDQEVVEEDHVPILRCWEYEEEESQQQQQRQQQQEEVG